MRNRLKPGWIVAPQVKRPVERLDFSLPATKSGIKDEFTFYLDESTAFGCQEEHHLYSSSRQKTVLCTSQDILHI